MTQWFLSYNGEQVGPLGQAEAAQRARMNNNGFAWREGFVEWVPIAQVAELNESSSSAAPPPLSRRASDEIDYKILGSEMQYVEIELDPGESCVAEAGSFFYKDSSIQMQTIFGDGSASQGEGIFDKLVGAGKRLVTGESLFFTVFTHQGSGKARVAFAAPYPGNIIPVTLANMGGSLICQKDSFLCAARGVSVGIYFQKRILTGLFGGEGFIMQKLEGDGLAFIHAGGTLAERQLKAGESMHVDTGCLVAFEPTVHFDVETAGGIKTMVFGGEGVFFANLKGPGKVWLQSLPFSRLAGRVLAGARSSSGNEEGSLLGAIGKLARGN